MEYLDETKAMCVKLRWYVAYKKDAHPFSVSELLPFDQILDWPCAYLAIVAQLDIFRLKIRRLQGLPPRDLQRSFMEIDHEILSLVILSLLLIEEGSCQFLSKECAQNSLLVNHLED